MKPFTCKLFAVLFLVSSAHASAASFSNEALWQAAAGAFNTDTFESYSSGTGLGVNSILGVTFDTLNDNVSQPTVFPTSFTGGSSVSGTNILLNDTDNALPGKGSIFFSASAPGSVITAVGFWNTGGDDTTILRFLDANGSLIEQVESGSGLTFVGIVAPVGATTIEILEGAQGNGYFTLDNLQVTVSAVPEPSTYILFGMGLLGLFALKRKKT